MRVIFFCKSSNLNLNIENAKKKKKNQKHFFVSEITGSENVAKIAFVERRILVTGSQRVNKQS